MLSEGLARFWLGRFREEMSRITTCLVLTHRVEGTKQDKTGSDMVMVQWWAAFLTSSVARASHWFGDKDLRVKFTPSGGREWAGAGRRRQCPETHSRKHSLKQEHFALDFSQTIAACFLHALKEREGTSCRKISIFCATQSEVEVGGSFADGLEGASPS